MLQKEGRVRIPSGCAIAGVFSKEGKGIPGDLIVRAMVPMHERSNGLGGGFAGYGIYPRYKDLYALHVFYDGEADKKTGEAFIEKMFDVADCSEIPTRKTPGICAEPLIWRYFVSPNPEELARSQVDEGEFVARAVLHVNAEIEGAYVFSSGKNMGAFKAVGFPEDVGEFYRLEEYEGYSWTAHGRYPTNTPGWWGGAHPFALLDISVVHNGEISSYDANRRWIEMFGYRCTLLTDTEAIAYIVDHLVRRKGLSMEEAALVMAAPFWSAIEKMDEKKKAELTFLRNIYGSLLVTGPFSILVGYTGGMMALNDRLKLRSMVAAQKGQTAYFASEECAIRAMEPDIDRIWQPMGGEPVIVTLNGGQNQCR